MQLLGRRTTNNHIISEAAINLSESKGKGVHGKKGKGGANNIITL